MPDQLDNIVDHSFLPRLLIGSGVALLPLIALAEPATGLEVILMRHADKDVSRGDYNLSPAGFIRAIALARLIPACLGAPTGIRTYVLDPQTSKNARSYQSAVPLAVVTGVPIQIAANSAEKSFEIGRELRQHKGPASERLVLFWEHRRIPELARGLGWQGMIPIGPEDFDQLFVFRFAKPGALPEVQSYRQSELMQGSCYTQARSPFT
ncbi:MAG: hypothetical protein WCI65_11265, partial [Synechococcaceae cyanobacterium ELA263]